MDFTAMLTDAYSMAASSRRFARHLPQSASEKDKPPSANPYEGLFGRQETVEARKERLRGQRIRELERQMFRVQAEIKRLQLAMEVRTSSGLPTDTLGRVLQVRHDKLLNLRALLATLNRMDDPLAKGQELSGVGLMAPSGPKLNVMA